VKAMRYNIPILVLFIVILAAIVFTYGLKTSRRKIVVAKGKNSIVINFTAIILLMIIVFLMLEDLNMYRWSLKTFIILGAIAALGLLLYGVPSINLNVFNSRKETIYETLETMLKRHCIDYEVKKSSIYIVNNKLYIRIWYDKLLKTCTLSLSNTKYPESIAMVFKDFKEEINNKDTNVKPVFGIFMIVLSLIFLILAAILSILWFYFIKD
jgi:hypothetical protein